MTLPSTYAVAPANRRLRQWVLAAVLVWLLGVLFVAAVVIPDLRQGLFSFVPFQEREWFLRSLVLAIVWPAIPFYMYMAVLAAYAVKRGSFPPPNVPLVVDMRISTGKPVLWRASWWLICAAVCAICFYVLLFPPFSL
jgi:hypothetical protein